VVHGAGRFSFVFRLERTSVRIPYICTDVELAGSSPPTAPARMIVKSCFGRFDIVTFPQASSRDSERATEQPHPQARLAAFVPPRSTERFACASG